MDKSANLGEMRSHSCDFLRKLFFLDSSQTDKHIMPIAKTIDAPINGHTTH